MGKAIRERAYPLSLVRRRCRTVVRAVEAEKEQEKAGAWGTAFRGTKSDEPTFLERQKSRTQDDKLLTTTPYNAIGQMMSICTCFKHGQIAKATRQLRAKRLVLLPGFDRMQDGWARSTDTAIIMPLSVVRICTLGQKAAKG